MSSRDGTLHPLHRRRICRASKMRCSSRSLKPEATPRTCRDMLALSQAIVRGLTPRAGQISVQIGLRAPHGSCLLSRTYTSVPLTPLLRSVKHTDKDAATEELMILGCGELTPCIYEQVSGRGSRSVSSRSSTVRHHVCNLLGQTVVLAMGNFRSYFHLGNLLSRSCVGI
ncbi:hypothetical protein FKP32DRAFT_832474 [Trametes sanguinea]|nr:hypothetical protein FKP32DRAFT_832474 [Trametes sanguinea]